ncbi:DUF397 domain-containing protein [Saccharopolyspora sp. K220]|nr:DUF397 domain-containing protein [Saccharopolyspora soli]
MRTGVRDAKDRAGGVLVVSASRWGSFVKSVKSGRYVR